MAIIATVSTISTITCIFGKSKKQGRKALFFHLKNKLPIVDMKKHKTRPNPVGKATAISVHFGLFVSFQTVMQVVEQGQ